ncbi:MAG: carbonic anhydrase, partial [Mesorhizobium sp.]
GEGRAAPLSPGDFIGKWMSLIAPAAETVASSTMMTTTERQTALERISIRYSLANLRTFPCVSILEGKGKLSLYGAWFDISTGELWVMNKETGDFERPEL